MAGNVYQYGIDLCDTEYIGFVDDDDELTSNYISEFYDVIKNQKPDIIIFKMLYVNGDVIPQYPKIHPGNVGISFVVKRSFILEKNIKFTNNSFCDFIFVSNVISNGGNLFFSDKICYLVRPKRKENFVNE